MISVNRPQFTLLIIVKMSRNNRISFHRFKFGSRSNEFHETSIISVFSNLLFGADFFFMMEIHISSMTILLSERTEISTSIIDQWITTRGCGIKMSE